VTRPRTLRVVDAVAQVREVDWDRLDSPAGFYQSYRWLGSLERTPAGRGRVRYLLVEDFEGLAAALPVYRYERPARNPLYDLPRLFESVGPWTQAGSLVGGCAAGYANGVPVRGDLPPAEAAAATALLLDGFSELAADDAVLAALPYLGEAAVERLPGSPRPLLRCGAEVTLDVDWATFEEYERVLSSGRRGIVRRDLRRLREAGLRLATARLADRLEEVPRLLDVVQRRHGVPSDPTQIRANLEGVLASGLGDQALVFEARRGGELVAACVAYEFRGTLYLRSVGLREEGAPAGAYFGVMFYAPIEHAIARGLTRIHLGTQSLRAKLLRGGVIAPLWSLLVGVELGPGAEAAWNDRAEAELDDDLGSLALARAQQGVPARA
jgi:hypothetical protein